MNRLKRIEKLLREQGAGEPKVYLFEQIGEGLYKEFGSNKIIDQEEKEKLLREQGNTLIIDDIKYTQQHLDDLEKDGNKVIALCWASSLKENKSL